MILSVWAPEANRVDLVLGELRIPMQRVTDGYWQTDANAEMSHGYFFSVDGSPPMPDPRSRWQPKGVHGPSHVVEAATLHGEADLKDFHAVPLQEAVIYELHLGTFTPEGTYAAAQARLPHLFELGITHVELMPLAAFPGERGWGYDGVDLYAPFSGYGTPWELAAFIRACHALKLAVLLDVVYNH